MLRQSLWGISQAHSEAFLLISKQKFGTLQRSSKPCCSTYSNPLFHCTQVFFFMKTTNGCSRRRFNGPLALLHRSCDLVFAIIRICGTITTTTISSAKSEISVLPTHHYFSQNSSSSFSTEKKKHYYVFGKTKNRIPPVSQTFDRRPPPLDFTQQCSLITAVFWSSACRLLAC